jgi:hypothetical protein
MDAPDFLLADLLIIAQILRYQEEMFVFALARFPFSIGQILLWRFRIPYP